MSWRDKVNFLYDDNDVYFLPEQHVDMYVYSTDKIVHTFCL
jgi:hypothetical protein